MKISWIFLNSKILTIYIKNSQFSKILTFFVVFVLVFISFPYQTELRCANNNLQLNYIIIKLHYYKLLISNRRMKRVQMHYLNNTTSEDKTPV